MWPLNQLDWCLTFWSHVFVFFFSCVTTTSLIWKTISIKSLVTVVQLTAGNGWIERCQQNICIPFYLFRPRKQFFTSILINENVRARFRPQNCKKVQTSVLVQWRMRWCSLWLSTFTLNINRLHTGNSELQRQCKCIFFLHERWDNGERGEW